MVTVPNRVFDNIRRLVEAERLGELTDRELLERFAFHRNEPAFAVLVRRHGPSVLGICRRIVRHHDAEDAFQAVFLVLARRAGAVHWRESVAGWLSRVARHMALRVRDRAPRRTEPMPIGEIAQAERGPDLEVRSILDEELDRLPEKYRAVVMLCLCEGMTRDAAARQLGWKPGAVKVRLERARAQLRARLARRGVALSATALGLTLARHAEAVPPALADLTAAAVPQFALHETTAAASRTAAILAEGALKTMLLTRVKFAALLALALGLMTGAAWFAPAGRSEPTPSGQASPTNAAPPADKGKEAKDANGPIRILLFADGPTREYQFVRRLLANEVDRKRAELSIYLQSNAGGAVQGVAAERLLKRFPARFEEPRPQEKPEARLENLRFYDVILAIDPDWTELTADQAKLLQKWVGDGGGLITIAGPVNTYRLTQAANLERLKSIVDLYPVELEDSRLKAAEMKQPSPLSFPAATEHGFLKLDAAGKEKTAGWSEFFYDKGSAEVKKEDPVLRGFYSRYPVKSVKPNALALATASAEPAQPYLVAQPHGKGRAVYLGSGETWRLRLYREGYHDHFWTGLIRYAASRAEPAAQAEPRGEKAGTARLPIDLANGVVDQNTETAYVVNSAGGIDALDLETGRVLWQSPKDQTVWPLCVVGNRLVVRVRDGQSARIAVLDATAEGRQLVKSEPLPFPGWAKPYNWLDQIATPGGPNAGRMYESWSFTSAERINGDELIIDWKALYSITRQPGFTSQPAFEQKQAAGRIRFDLKSAAMKTHEDAEGAIPKRTIAQAPIVEKFQVGDRDYAVVEVPNRERKLVATDRTSGKVLWEHPLRCQFRLPPRS